ncbi:MAG: type II secretion system F family protein [Firmicutes bacterium]|nr:type II secretion system F family protein [Bacillota bacterium]
MPKFKYTAVDAEGKNVKGTLFATSLAEFNATLKQKGEYVLNVQEIKDDDTGSLANANAIKMKELSILCKQFATMLSSGITIIKCLDVLYQQQEKKKLKEILLKVYEQVQVGKSLSKALASTEGAFPNFMISMIEAGEMSGSIDLIMNRLAVHYEKQCKIKSKVQSAMIYPIILLIVCVLVVSGLFIFVIPNLMGMFGEKENLPALTRFLMDASDFMVHRWYILLIIVIGTIIFVGIFRNTRFVRGMIDRIKLFTPGVGKLYAVVMSSNFCSTMYSVFSSGMTLLTSLELTTNVLDNSVVSERMSVVMDEIRAGGALSNSLHKTQLFPNMMVTMVSVGEESGSLDEVLEKTADFYETEADDAIQKLVSMLEPIMILVMGGLVGTVIIGIMMPMFGMYGQVESQT